MPELSRAADQLVGQKMFQILAEAQRLEGTGKSLVHFEIGQPDFKTPSHVCEAAIDAIKSGDTEYVNSRGIYELRVAAIEATEKSRKFTPDLDQVLVTPGANIQIYLAIACTVNPGEEVIIPDPGFVTYAAMINLIGAVAVRVSLREENGFRLDPFDLEMAITTKTRMVIVNSPNNPTGSVMNEVHVKKIYELAERHDLFILSDEIYARMVYPDPEIRFCSPSIYDACRKRSIIVNGFSKSYAMTGWRLGVVTGPHDVVRKMGLMLETIMSCTPPFVQRAGIAALQGSQYEVDLMISEYRKRRDLLVDGLNTIPGFRCLKPEGAFYVFPNITGTGLSSDEIAERLMHVAGVVVAPGNIFGPAGEGYIRMCYANSLEAIEIGLDRIHRALS